MKNLIFVYNEVMAFTLFGRELVASTSMVVFALFIFQNSSFAQTDSVKCDEISDSSVVGTYIYFGSIRAKHNKLLLKPNKEYVETSRRSKYNYTIKGTWEIRNDTLMLTDGNVLRIPFKHVLINGRLYDAPVELTKLEKQYWIKKEE